MKRWLSMVLALVLAIGALSLVPFGPIALAKEAAKVNRVEAPRKAMPAADPLQFKVETSRNAKVLILSESRGGKEYKTWKASKFSKVDGDSRVWEVSYTFGKAGTYNLRFAASTDSKGSLIGLTRKITVWLNDDPAVKKIKLNASGTLKLPAGDSFKLKATFSPEKAKSDLTWASSNEKVAQVSASGEVKALKRGTATVTVTSTNGTKAKVKVKVTKAKKPANTVKPTTKPTAKPTAAPTATPRPSGKLPYSEDLSVYLGKNLYDSATALGFSEKDVAYYAKDDEYYLNPGYGFELRAYEFDWDKYAYHVVREVNLTLAGTAGSNIKENKFSICGLKLGMDRQTVVNVMTSKGWEAKYATYGLKGFFKDGLEIDTAFDAENGDTLRHASLTEKTEFY